MFLNTKCSKICPCLFFSTRDNVCWGISGCFPVSSRVCRFDPFLNSKQVELIPVYENNNNMHAMICVMKYIVYICIDSVIYLYAWCKKMLRFGFRKICVKQPVQQKLQ